MVAFSSSSSIFCQVCRGRSAEGQGDGTGERLVRCPSRQNVRARQRKGITICIIMLPRRRPRRVGGDAARTERESHYTFCNQTSTRKPTPTSPHTASYAPSVARRRPTSSCACGTWSRGARNYIPSVILPLASGCVAKGSSRMELNQRTEAAFTSHSRQLMLKFSASESPFPNGSRKDLESSRKPR